MPKPFKRIRRSSHRQHEDKNAFAHWLIDEQAYFITARCREGTPAFATDRAMEIFLAQFEKYTALFGFEPWLLSILHNHYHFLGILRVGENLPKLMQRLHGSVAKLVNDTLEIRLSPFWRDTKGKEYFDGCLRDEKQGRRAYRYTLLQAVRAGIASDSREYRFTRVYVELERAIADARNRKAFLEGVPYKRYER